MDRGIPTVDIEFRSGFPLWTQHHCVISSKTTVCIPTAVDLATAVALEVLYAYYSCSVLDLVVLASSLDGPQLDM